MAKLVEGEMPDVVPEAKRVDSSRLLNQYPRRYSVEQNLPGRKLAGRAEVDVGATSRVDRGNASDWTTTSIASASLLMSLSCTPCSEAVDITTHEGSPCPAAPVRLQHGLRRPLKAPRLRCCSPCCTRARAASISAERTAVDTAVPSAVRSASARAASSSGRNVIVSAMLCKCSTLCKTSLAGCRAENDSKLYRAGTYAGALAPRSPKP